MASILYVGAGSSNTGATQTITVPTNYKSNDLLLLFVETGSNGVIFPQLSAGWSTVVSQAGTPGLCVYKKTASDSESAVVLNSLSSFTTSVMIAYRFANDVEVVGPITQSVGTSFSTSSLTTLSNYSCIVSCYDINNTSNTGATLISPEPTINRVTVLPTQNTRGILLSDEIQASPGTSTSRTATSNVSLNYTSVALSLSASSVGKTKTIVYTSGSGNWTVPSDWSDRNTIHLIGGGASGSGGAALISASAGSGGGGGGYTKIVNFKTTPGATISYSVGAGGTTPQLSTAAGNTAGNTTFNSSQYIAYGGGALQGNFTLGGVGITYNGGDGAPKYQYDTFNIFGGGGGGAGGFYGKGNNANASSGGTGTQGWGGRSNTSINGVNGSNGSELYGYGSGSGGTGSTFGISGNGGNYGAGGAGGGYIRTGFPLSNFYGIPANGTNGLIVIEYTPNSSLKHRLSNTGNLTTVTTFDETTYSNNKFANNTIYSSQLNEITSIVPETISATKTVLFTNTGYTSYTLPSDFASLVSVEAIGGGGAGGAGNLTNGTSGGGGAYAASNNVSGLVPGNTVYIFVGAGGTTTSASGANSWFNTSNTAPVSSTTGCLAVGGTGGGNQTTVPGWGGAAANCIGTLKNSGGNSGITAAFNSRPGAGGAGGPSGAGGDGGRAGSPGNVGAGGGGSNGGSAGGIATATAGSGGNGLGGTGGGGPGVAGTAGTGGGGGGATSVTTAAGAGGSGAIWTDSSTGAVAGPGGGAGGSAGNNASAVGAPPGGLYGGGGGCQPAGVLFFTGYGAQGIVVLNYISSANASVTPMRLSNTGTLYVSGTFDEVSKVE